MPQAGTCLRQLTEQSVPENIEHWIIISPKYLSTVKGGCPHYRSSTKVRYAQGFIGILENLPYKQMQTVILHLMNYLGRRTYYRARKGERLLSPSEQQHILNILRNRVLLRCNIGSLEFCERIQCGFLHPAMPQICPIHLCSSCVFSEIQLHALLNLRSSFCRGSFSSSDFMEYSPNRCASGA